MWHLLNLPLDITSSENIDYPCRTSLMSGGVISVEGWEGALSVPSSPALIPPCGLQAVLSRQRVQTPCSVTLSHSWLSQVLTRSLFLQFKISDVAGTCFSLYKNQREGFNRRFQLSHLHQCMDCKAALLRNAGFARRSVNLMSTIQHQFLFWFPH